LKSLFLFGRALNPKLSGVAKRIRRKVQRGLKIHFINPRLVLEVRPATSQ
jgi:hypothetical protein